MVHVAGQAGHGLGVGHIDMVLERRPGHGPVHGPGVEPFDPEVRGHGLRQGGLPGSGRTVDGDHPDLGHRGPGDTVIGRVIVVAP